MRFEVLKRDSFKCQYCGKSSPNVVLEIDHLEPVAKGGDNDVTNLITSCKECNSGKSDRRIDDNSVIAKQKHQLDLLQERREQIELMLKWRKGLDAIEDDTTLMVTEYVEEKISGYSINENGKSSLVKNIKKYGLADVLIAIDISAGKYLRYDQSDSLIKESVEDFYNKIGGILVNMRRSPIGQKLSYIKGICRNKFSDWNAAAGSIVLNEYVAALKGAGWDEERVLDDLESELEPKAKSSVDWRDFKMLIEKWTNDVLEWPKSEPEDERGYSEAELSEITQNILVDRQGLLLTINYLGNAFDEYSPDYFRAKLDLCFEYYLTSLEEHYFEQGKSEDALPSFSRIAVEQKLFYGFIRIDSPLKFHLEFAARSLVSNFIGNIDGEFNFSSAKPEYFHHIATRYVNETKTILS